MLREGVPCRSKYEAMYDTYLHENNIEHKHEVKIGPYIADVKIGNEYHEIAGMIGYPKYNKKHELKKQYYLENNIAVKWFLIKDIDKLYENCKTEIIYRERICEDCKVKTHDIVKNVCRNCYMKRWHNKGQQKICEQCKTVFPAADIDCRRFCSHDCYSKSIKKIDEQSIISEISSGGKTPYRIAIEKGLRPGTVYQMLIRKANKDRGLTGEGKTRKTQ